MGPLRYCAWLAYGLRFVNKEPGSDIASASAFGGRLGMQDTTIEHLLHVTSPLNISR
jgi:hypothetical protein